MWEWQDRRPTPDGGVVRWGFTAARPRAGGGAASGGADAPGAGAGPYAGLNLGGHVGDDPAVVEANRGRLAADLGIARTALRFMNQVHGATVAMVDEIDVVDPSRTPDAPVPVIPEADAMVTTRPGIALAVLVADCVPVVLADAAVGVIGVAHAGRPGLIAGVVPAVVAAMRALGADAITAAVGPSVCGRCYEVPAEMRAAGAAASPVSATVSWTGTPALDIAAGVVAQLSELGVPLTWVPGCTRESPHLYSYRRSQVTGRFAGVVLREAP